MASDVEWVEIRCPRSGEPMFANLETGECLWEVPLGALVKGANPNQWWELYDVNSGKHYYHNSTSNKTVWKKPAGAEVLPLTKLQAQRGPVRGKSNGSNLAQSGPVRGNCGNFNGSTLPSENSIPDALYEDDSPLSSTGTLDRNSLNSNPPPLSPYAVKPSKGSIVRPNKQGKMPPPVASKPATLKRVTITIAQTQGEDTPGSHTEQTDCRSAEHADGQTAGQADLFNSEKRLFSDNPPPLNSVKRTESAPDPMGHMAEPVTIRVGKSIENLSNIDDCDELDIPVHGQSIPDIASQLSRENRSNMERLKQNRHESRYSSFHDYSAPAKYCESKNRSIQDQDDPSILLDPTEPQTPPPSPPPYVVHREGQGLLLKWNSKEGPLDSDVEEGLWIEDGAGNVYQWKRRHSAELSPAPHKEKKGNKKSIVRSPTSPIPKLPKDKEFVKRNINRPRGMFKKVSIATMLAHSKESIKKPIILTQDKQVRKDAVICFKNLQEYMGDTKLGKGLRDRERLKKAADLCYMGWQKVCFRDEFFMQVIKQTTCNPKNKSLEWGWKLMSAYLYYFPPTIRFQSYLEGYLYKNTENDQNQVPVQVYAEYCHERLAKMVIHGGKHGTKKPTEEDITHAMNLPFKKSMFGATLEEVMELQKETHTSNYLPWVLSLLADKVIQYGGYTTEGIFRVPGDIDKVSALKMSLDNGDFVNEFPTTDAPVCASLLKEWLRELYDPAITHELYQKCLDNCEQAAFCASIISELPDINRLVVAFVIRFLQGFLKDDTVKKTKMTADNLAMVFAPNLLRCPSTDLQVAMDNSKWEMTFVRTLINTLDTSYIDGVV